MSKTIQVSILLELEVDSDVNFVSIDSDGGFEGWQVAPRLEGFYWYPEKEQGSSSVVDVINFRQLCFKV